MTIAGSSRLPALLCPKFHHKRQSMVRASTCVYTPLDNEQRRGAEGLWISAQHNSAGGLLCAA
jgi:hypothetical protein